MTCKQIVLFYEKHTEGSSAEATREVLLALNDEGYSPTVCMEVPVDESIETTKKSYSLDIANIPVVKSFDDQAIKTMINNMGIFIGGKEYRSHKEAREELSSTQKKSVIGLFHKESNKLAKAAKANLKLINSISNYCKIDMPTAERAEIEKTLKPLAARKICNKYMAKQLQEHCENTDDYVIGLLGSSHFDVSSKLRALGLKVQDYYIVESPIEITSSDIGDLCLRANPNAKICKNYAPFQGIVYDLYLNPELNPNKKIIGQILTDQNHDDL